VWILRFGALNVVGASPTKIRLFSQQTITDRGVGVDAREQSVRQNEREGKVRLMKILYGNWATRM